MTLFTFLCNPNPIPSANPRHKPITLSSIFYNKNIGQMQFTFCDLMYWSKIRSLVEKRRSLGQRSRSRSTQSKKGHFGHNFGSNKDRCMKPTTFCWPKTFPSDSCFGQDVRLTNGRSNDVIIWRQILMWLFFTFFDVWVFESVTLRVISLLSKTIVFESMSVVMFVCLFVCLLLSKTIVFESMLVVMFVCLSVCLFVC